GLAGADHGLGRTTADLDRDEDRRVLEVVVADVVPSDLAVPEQLARRAVEGDERVGVGVGAGPAARVRVARAERGRTRVAGAEKDASVRVDSGRVPETAAAVHLRVAPELRAALHGREAPELLARVRVERVDHAVGAGEVERGPVSRDRGHEEPAVVEL